MTIWKHLRETWPNWPSIKAAATNPPTERSAEDHLELARESLRDLLQDERVPDEVRHALTDDYQQVESMLDKIEHGHIHIAVFGRVSVGKSALVNALLGEARFTTSPLHGETQDAQLGQWSEFRDGNVFLIDTPGINELFGEARESLAHEVAERADLVVFVADSDLTAPEMMALRILGKSQRPIIVALNKIDQYTPEERTALTEAIGEHLQQMVQPENIVMTAAKPREQLLIHVDEAGNEVEELRQPEPDIEALRTRLWAVLEAEGKTLSALNASLFAGHLSDQIARRVLSARRALGENVIRTWCIAKGVAVALNPVPVADLVAAAVVDVSMVVHLSRVYGLPLTRSEAGDLVKTVGAQMMLLLGTIWAVHLLSSALKLGTGGVSAVFTGGVQGAVAYYSTYVVGQAAERYLANGKSWGEAGPKYVVREILDNLDRDSILEQAKADIRARLRADKT